MTQLVSIECVCAIMSLRVEMDPCTTPLQQRFEVAADSYQCVLASLTHALHLTRGAYLCALSGCANRAQLLPRPLPCNLSNKQLYTIS